MGLLPAKGVTQWILFWDRRKACVIKAEAYLAKGAFEEALQKTVFWTLSKKRFWTLSKKSPRWGGRGEPKLYNILPLIGLTLAFDKLTASRLFLRKY